MLLVLPPGAQFLSLPLISIDPSLSSFNLLKLPEYPSKELLEEKLTIALTCGSGIIDLT